MAPYPVTRTDRGIIRGLARLGRSASCQAAYVNRTYPDAPVGTRPGRSLPAVGAGKSVQVRGANDAQRALEAGVLDEIQIHQIPVLLGEGRRLFDVLPGLVELEIRRVIDTHEATHIRYVVRH